MAVAYTQTNTAGDCTILGGGGDLEAAEGATPGSTPVSRTITAEAADEVLIAFVVVIGASTTWTTGTWTIRLNITTENMFGTWDYVQVQRYSTPGCSLQETVYTNSAVGISIGTTGTKSMTTSSISFSSPAATDVVVIRLGFNNSNMGAQNFSFTPSVNIDSPFTNATGATINAPLGSIVTSTFAPAVAGGASVAAPLGSLVVNGFAPAVGIGANIQSPTGSLVTTGFVPQVLAGANVGAPTGSLVVTGFVPAVAGGAAVGAPTGSAVLSGFAPSVGIGQNIQAPLGSLVTTGFAPSVAGGANVGAPTGSAVLTSFAPIVGTGATVAAPLGSAILTGFIPTVTAGGSGATIAAPLGSLVVTGFEPTVTAVGGTTTLSGVRQGTSVSTFKSVRYPVRTGKGGLTGIDQE